ncbi:trypsin I-P1-like [Cochliomyia hominivorax]
MQPSGIRVVARTPVRLRKTPYTQILRVKKIIVHEFYQIDAFNFDIALLRLRDHIKFDKYCASAIDVPQYRINNNNSFSLCSVLGWGKLFMHGPLANEILQLNVMLHSKDFCSIILSDVGKSKICASDLMDYEKNPCSGDSGGPLICDGHLTGLVSFGVYCGHGLPTVYTEVYEYKTWIEKSKSEKIEAMDIFLSSILVFCAMNYFVK